MTFRILTVCTGNICRSPLAAQLLWVELGKPAGVVVASAGTAAMSGRSTDERAARFSRAHAGAPEGHAARNLTVGEVRASDLILAMSRDHRRAVVELVPRSTRSTFTLREFARLVANLDAESRRTLQALPRHETERRLRTLVDAAVTVRGTLPRLDEATDDDVADPYELDDASYERSCEQILAAARAIAAMVGCDL